jgi:hypothetical protein
MISEGYLGLQLDNGELVPVPHPAEHFTLERHGYTFKTARRERRLYWVSYKVCRDCGVISQEAQIRSQSGCLPMLISLPVSFVGLKFVLGMNWLLAINLAMVGVFIVAVFATVIDRVRWRKRNRELKVGNCPQCGATHFVDVTRVGGRSLMCTHCHTRNVRCVFAAIS